VTKRRYLEACEYEPTLPLDRTEEDDPHRRLLVAVVARATKRRKKP
jgi:hypothetical protein